MKPHARASSTPRRARRPVAIRRLSAFVALVGLVGIVPAQLAADPRERAAAILYPDDDLLAAAPRDREFTLIAKYVGLVEEEIQLAGIDVRAVLADIDLAKDLLQLHTGRDNIEVRAVLRKDGKDDILEISSIKPAPSDEELYRARLRAIFQRADRDSDLLLRIARTLERLKSFPDGDKLGPMKTKAAFECFRLWEKGLPAGALAPRLEFALKIYHEIPDAQLLGELLKHLASRYPDSPELATRLRALGFWRIRDQWLDYEEFKTREGFIRHDGQWLLRSEVEFLDVVEQVRDENVTNLILRSQTNRAYAQLAATGKVARGMTLEEAAHALGFPERVRRSVVESREVDQWDFGDVRVYFFNNQVYSVLGDSEAPAAGADSGKR